MDREFNTTNIGDEQLLTTDEAAKVLRISKPTLNRWRAEGQGPRYIRLGTWAVRYRKSDLLQCIKDGESGHTPNTGGC